MVQRLKNCGEFFILRLESLIVVGSFSNFLKLVETVVFISLQVCGGAYVKTMSLRLVSVIFFTPPLFLSGLLGSGSQTSSWSCPKEIGCKSYWKERENCWGRTWAASRPISWETSPTKVILIWFGLLQPLAYIVSTFWIFGSKITEVGIWTWPFVNCSIVMGEWSLLPILWGKLDMGATYPCAFYIVFAIPETFCSRVVSLLINSLLGDHSF